MTETEHAQESVWDYPRPPAVRAAPGRLVEVWFAERLVASTRQAVRVLETSHPPVYYLPAADVATELLTPGGAVTHCEWKGQARYWDLEVGARRAAQAAWSYPEPLPAYRELRGMLAFHPGLVDRCTVDGETVRAQEGGFYGGWITAGITGPYKGGPGTWAW
ncbi:hypothetical protein GCM10010495_69180 [Kitasatospora herbaricolor]|uniref:DUF427 domain-containing protein n=1 Tax=Kitasatospora herbaricolor TaxID=68217 RepID=UPI00174B3745|nr:DUF427 domain-containing protein [Kitasatospora herbaricolor]MDQ0306238.1 uncharacterized protein (DUF427 family) [Kitasatospora herbaricolor]GGV41743.1 hypothetical protein GCM10010495_69180 [Kitasatospora herbaricolor]